MRKSEMIIEGILQDERVTYTLVEISEICVIDLPVLDQMLEYGIIEPQIKDHGKHYDYRALRRVKKAVRLHHDLAINWEGISLVLDLLEEIDTLHRRLDESRGKEDVS